MKVLLLNPTINPKTQNRIITEIIRASFPFSLGHLAGYLLHNGNFPVQIIDEQITPLSDADIEALISGMEGPKIIGITTLTATCSRAYELSDRIKQIDANATVILGGVHVSVMPEEGLGRKGVDIVVRGEGEITLSEIVKCIFDGTDYYGVQGISFKRNGSFVHNPDRPLIKDLNTLPLFPYHLFEKDFERYPGFSSIQTSRGCPYGCIFCSQRNISGRGYRYVRAERALQDIETLANRYGSRLIRIMDDNIGANKKRLMELLEMIIDKGFNKRVSFEAPMRGDNLDLEILEKLKEANFSLLTFGLETASESLMTMINKGESVDDVVNAIKMTASKGISTGTTLIFGLPTESGKDRWEAIKLVSSLPLDSVRFNLLTPYPGTPIYNQLIKDNRIIIREGWENFSVQYMWEGDDLPYVPDNTGRYELMFTTMLANLLFYVRPSGIKKLFTKSAAGGNVISLTNRWYFTGFLFKIIRVGSYLSRRFIVIFLKMMYEKIARNK